MHPLANTSQPSSVRMMPSNKKEAENDILIFWYTCSIYVLCHLFLYTQTEVINSLFSKASLKCHERSQRKKRVKNWWWGFYSTFIRLLPMYLLRSSLSLMSFALPVVLLSLSWPPSLWHAVWLFLGSPGDTVLLSCLTKWHGQNESFSVLPGARLSPEGGLAGHISMRLLWLVCTGCDRPRAPLLLIHWMKYCNTAITDGPNQWDGHHMLSTAWEIF